MKLVVLAAGRGRRMESLTDDLPKCLVELGDGTSLLSRLLTQASLSGHVHEVVVCAGYQSDAVMAEVTRWADVIPAVVRINPWFAQSGPIVSLWVVRDLLAADDFMICNGDTYYSSELLDTVANGGREGIRLAVDTYRANAPDGMRVAFNEDGSIRTISKTVPAGEAGAVSTGLVGIFGAAARQAVIDAINVDTHDGADGWSLHPWHSLLDGLGFVGSGIETARVQPDSWWEVDTARDLERLRKRLERADHIPAQGAT